MTAHTGFRYVGEWDSFKATYHRRLAKILIDISASTFRLEQEDQQLLFYTKGASTPLVLTLDPPVYTSLVFADSIAHIEEDLENYFQEKRLIAEKQQKRLIALAKLSDDEKALLGIHEFKDVNIAKPPEVIDTTPETKEEQKKYYGMPYINYFPNEGGYAVCRWVYTGITDGYEEKWNAELNTWATNASEYLCLSKAEGLKQVLSFKMSEEAEVKRQKHPKGAYLVDRADGVLGHYTVGRWVKEKYKIQPYQEVWNTKMNGWASCCSEVLSLEEATKLMNELNAKNLG